MKRMAGRVVLAARHSIGFLGPDRGAGREVAEVLARTAIAVCMIACSACARADLVGIASVIDGDTIEIHGQRIRLEGIDAPESGQTCTRAGGQSWRCGQAAAVALSEHIGRAVIRCEPSGADHYGRTLAACFKDAEDLNRWLVSVGLAVAYRRYSLAYVGAEEEAHRGRLGVWSGEFDMPWIWRAEHRH